jgi:hypothetical protein
MITVDIEVAALIVGAAAAAKENVIEIETEIGIVNEIVSVTGVEFEHTKPYCFFISHQENTLFRHCVEAAVFSLPASAGLACLSAVRRRDRAAGDDTSSTRAESGGCGTTITRCAVGAGLTRISTPVSIGGVCLSELITVPALVGCRAAIAEADIAICRISGEESGREGLI